MCFQRPATRFQNASSKRAVSSEITPKKKRSTQTQTQTQTGESATEIKTKRARIEHAQSRVLESVVKSALLQRSVSGNMSRFEAPRYTLYRNYHSANRDSALDFEFSTNVTMRFGGGNGYLIKVRVILALSLSNECVDHSEDETFDRAARHNHDRQLIDSQRCVRTENGEDDAGQSRPCGCKWRLCITNPDFGLRLSNRFKSLHEATETAISALPTLQMCDECGKMVCLGEHFNPTSPATIATGETDQSSLAEALSWLDSHPNTLCHKCIGTILLSRSITTTQSVNTCGICHNEIRIGFLTSCNHHFHKRCVRLHRHFGNDTDCPLCRRSNALLP